MISLNVNHKPQACVQDTVHPPSLTANFLCCCGKILASKGHIHYEPHAFLEVHTGIKESKSIRYMAKPLPHRTNRRTGHTVSPASSYSICTIIRAACSCLPKYYSLEAQNKLACVSPPDPSPLTLFRDNKLIKVPPSHRMMSSTTHVGNPGWHQHSHWRTLSTHHKNLPSPSATSVPAWEGEGPTCRGQGPSSPVPTPKILAMKAKFS